MSSESQFNTDIQKADAEKGARDMIKAVRRHNFMQNMFVGALSCPLSFIAIYIAGKQLTINEFVVMLVWVAFFSLIGLWGGNRFFTLYNNMHPIPRRAIFKMRSYFKSFTLYILVNVILFSIIIAFFIWLIATKSEVSYGYFAWIFYFLIFFMVVLIGDVSSRVRLPYWTFYHKYYDHILSKSAEEMNYNNGEKPADSTKLKK
ncbi:MAG: hypothetical protein PHH26_09250 [Candidatus Thermoplasmatota archaeon]|nr:hypothetical protein [Candidatus Thermoplasmatota archaeon]